MNEEKTKNETKDFSDKDTDDYGRVRYKTKIIALGLV